MRREGSPWTGLWAVFFKEMADHLSGLRMRILEGLILLSALAAVYTGSQALRQTVGEDPYLYLKLLTTAQDPLPSFVGFLSFFVPLAAIALAFDAVNGEYARGTLSRVLSQPIYRDALLFGKFLAGLGTLAVLLLALLLLVLGLGVFTLGVPPGGEEVGRILFFFLATLAYAGVWLALGLLFSVLFRQPATAALAAIGVWLFFAVFFPILTDLAASAFLLQADPFDPESQLRQANLALWFSASPPTPSSPRPSPPS
jgi:ABC-2 type transport system permease protein